MFSKTVPGNRLKHLQYIALLLVFILLLSGCPKSDSPYEMNPNAPSRYLTIQSDTDTLYNRNYYIDSQPVESDSAVFAEINPPQSGRLVKVRLMFGNWIVDSDTFKVPPHVAVRVFAKRDTVPSDTPLVTKLIADSTIRKNAGSSYVWTEVAVDSANILIRANQHFYVSVTPLFSDVSTTSQQRLYLCANTDLPVVTPVQTWIMNRDRLLQLVPNIDVAVGVVVRY